MSENLLNNASFQNDPYILPDGKIMLIGEIRRLIACLPFSYLPGFRRSSVSCPALSKSKFHLYFFFHDLTEDFGLPHGKGWANETAFCMKVLRFFKKTSKQIDSWIAERQNKSG